MRIPKLHALLAHAVQFVRLVICWAKLGKPLLIFETSIPIILQPVSRFSATCNMRGLDLFLI